MAGKCLLFYYDWEDALSGLSDADFRRFVMAMLHYSKDRTKDDLPANLSLAFSVIKAQIERDNKKWEEISKKRSDAGKKGAEVTNAANASKSSKCQQIQQVPANAASASKSSKCQQMRQTAANSAVTDTVTVTDTDTVTVTDTDTVTDTGIIPPYYPPKGDVTELSPKDQTDFLEFWGAYPNKVGKKAALSAWEKLSPDAELRGKIMKALKEQKASDQWRRENGRYIPSPIKWLNQERWEDELKAAEQEGQYKPDFSKWELPDEPDYGGAHVIKSQEDVEEIFKDWDSGG